LSNHGRIIPKTHKAFQRTARGLSYKVKMTEKNKLYAIGGKSRTGKTKISGTVATRHGSLEVFGTDTFRPHRNDDFAWRDLVGHLTTTHLTSDVLIEGVAITPQRVQELKVDHLVLQKAVFLGFERESHADTILEHARREPKGNWVAAKLKANPAYENDVRNWMQPGVQQSAELKKEADKWGYGYFDITDYPTFEEYANAVATYLLDASMTEP
jgi:hypothetical protein